MFESLSNEQKQVVNYDNGLAVVRACPGSGKTYSVAARIATLMNKMNLGKKGVVALSYTNVACEEIKDKLLKEFRIGNIRSPHFIGTLDSFINKYIFLPYGHLVMGCSKRPILVGEPHFPWNIKRFEHDEYQYFDKTTFNLKDELIPLAPPIVFKRLLWKNYYVKSGEVHGSFQKIIKAKRNLHKQGYATQADANYFALRILQKYPLIKDNIAHKFGYFIIDEAQDTDEVLMAIIDELVSVGATNFMLVGDRDQSIFEWNNAKPELFDLKYEEWNKIDIKENRRSSQLICNFTNPLSSFRSTIAINEEVKDFTYVPNISGYLKKQNSKQGWVVSPEDSRVSFTQILDTFLTECSQHGIEVTEKNVAIIYRGKGKMELLGLCPPDYSFETGPWQDKSYYIKTIMKGLFLYENGYFNRGFHLMERGFIEMLKRNQKNGDPLFICSDYFIEDLISESGFSKYRSKIFEFIDILPATTGRTINDWILATNQSFIASNKGAIQFKINQEGSGINISSYFEYELEKKGVFPFYHGTIHSVKGKTFEAVLLILDKGSPKHYKTTLYATIDNLTLKDEEELRMVYVGMTRPRKLLKIAVPNDDVVIWRNKMNPIDISI